MTATSNLDNLEFKVIKEVWNEYELNDGTKLRGRMFLTRISEDKNAPKAESPKSGKKLVNYNFSFGKHFEVFAPKDQLSGPTGHIPPSHSIPDDKKSEVDPILLSEPWNSYEIVKNGTVIKIKLVVSEIFKVDGIYDQFGQPYYILKHGPVFDAKPNSDKKKFA